jgi:lipoprotein-anchoring transpeptidase ErfK/SrfK
MSSRGGSTSTSAVSAMRMRERDRPMTRSRRRNLTGARLTWFVGAAALSFSALVLLLASPAVGSAAPRTDSATSKAFPVRYMLTNADVGHWADILRNVVVHRQPSATSAAVTRLSAVTPQWTQNVVLVLVGIVINPSETWYKVRLPILPNNSTGWVPRRALGNLYAVHTHLYVNRETFTATLKRDGRTIFTTRVGVGSPRWPTPAGQFYIRDEVTGLKPFYGPIAFGTSGRSAVLTDWPGGGFIGVHGTNTPQILPGAVSHGCIRMLNQAIIRLSRLMEVGTPLTIT